MSGATLLSADEIFGPPTYMHVLNAIFDYVVRVFSVVLGARVIHLARRVPHDPSRRRDRLRGP